MSKSLKCLFFPTTEEIFLFFLDRCDPNLVWIVVNLNSSPTGETCFVSEPLNEARDGEGSIKTEC